MFEAFQIDPNDYSKLSFDLLNNHHAPVDVDILPRLIAQHKNSGSFYIEVLLEQPNNIVFISVRMQDDFYNAKSKKGTIFHRIKNMSAANKTKPVNIIETMCCF